MDHANTAPPTSLDLLSIGALGAMLGPGVGIGVVRRAIEAAGVKPALTLDTVPYFRREDVVQIRAKVG